MDELYRRLLEFTRDGVYRYTFDEGRLLFANQGLVDILDLDCRPQEIQGRRLRDLMVYTEKEGSIRHLLEEYGEIHRFEYHFRTLKGEEKWVLHDSFLSLNEATGERTVDAIVKDITVLKRAEQEIARERERLSVTLRSIGDGVIATNTDARIVEINGVAEELTGWSQREALGRPLHEVFRIVNEATRKPCENPAEKALQTNAVVTLANHTVLMARDCRERTIADSGAPIRDRQGNVIGVVLVFRDITERCAVEEELRRHREHLTELVEERTVQLSRANELLALEVGERKRAEERLRRMLQELERSNRDLEQFAYVASHDLQEPLRMVASYVQLLARRYQGKLDKDADEFMAFAVDGALRMQLLIDDLLLYSRVSRRTEPFEPVDCGALLDRVLRYLARPIEESGGAVTREALPTVAGDPSQLGQVFQNLVVNAIKFHGDEAPRVHVSAERKGGEWQFCVRDNGIGIEPQYLDRIFVIFQRLHPKDKYPGTGIGLAICKKIVEHHGGRIWVESTPGKGSAFYFTVPATD